MVQVVNICRVINALITRVAILPLDTATVMSTGSDRVAIVSAMGRKRVVCTVTAMRTDHANAKISGTDQIATNIALKSCVATELAMRMADVPATSIILAP